MIQKSLLVAAGVLAAGAAQAGPVDDALGQLIGANAAYWAELVAVVSALFGLLSALVPDERMGKFAPIVNAISSNWGRASNDPANNGPSA